MGPRCTGRGRRVVATLAVLVLGAGAAGCGDDVPTEVSGAAGSPQPGGALVFGIEAETDGGWNPISTRFAISGHTVGSALFDPLVVVDSDGDPQPYLAESVQPNLDHTEWRIVLRPGVTFHDGTELDAEAVKANLDAHRESVLTGAVLDWVEDVRVQDDRTVVVEMSRPWVAFAYTLAGQVGYVAAPSMLVDPDGAAQPVGTGPFELEEWVPGDHVDVVRNEDYWRPDHPYLDRIEFRVIPDPAERAEALRDGDVDLIHTVRDEDVLAFRSDPDVRVVEDDSGEETFALLNLAAPPFDDPGARRALASATDQGRLVDVLGSGIVRQATSLFPEGTPWHPDDPGYPAYDPDEARRLLDEYEAEHGEPLSFTYLSTPTADNLALAQLLQSMWGDVGIEVEIGTRSQPDLINDAITGDFEAANWRLFGNPDPDGELVWLHSGHAEPVGEISLNFARLESDAVDAALEAGRTEAEPEARVAAYQDLATAVNAELPFVWLQQTLWAVVARSSVQGVAAATEGGIGALQAKPWLADLWIPA